jgi:hypothetical protein
MKINVFMTATSPVQTALDLQFCVKYIILLRVYIVYNILNDSPRISFSNFPFICVTIQILNFIRKSNGYFKTKKYEEL